MPMFLVQSATLTLAAQPAGPEAPQATGSRQVTDPSTYAHFLPCFPPLQDQKNRKLNDLLDALDFNQVVIFVKSVARARELNKLLNECNFPSTAIHAGWVGVGGVLRVGVREGCEGWGPRCFLNKRVPPSTPPSMLMEAGCRPVWGKRAGPPPARAACREAAGGLGRQRLAAGPGHC